MSPTENSAINRRRIFRELHSLGLTVNGTAEASNQRPNVRKLAWTTSVFEEDIEKQQSFSRQDAVVKPVRSFVKMVIVSTLGAIVILAFCFKTWRK